MRENSWVSSPCQVPPWRGNSHTGGERAVRSAIQQVLKVWDLCLSCLLNLPEIEMQVSPSINTHGHLKCSLQQRLRDTQDTYSSIKWKDLIHSFHFNLTSEEKNIINFISDLAWRCRQSKSNERKAGRLSWVLIFSFKKKLNVGLLVLKKMLWSECLCSPKLKYWNPKV